MTTDLQTSILGAWRTNNRVTIELIRQLPKKLWGLRVEGTHRRTVRVIVAHLHNSRCSWIKTLGQEHGIKTPERVDRDRVTSRELVAALKRSSSGMEDLLKLAFASQGELPPSKGYVWRNLSLDAGHVLTYFVAHEAHHRGQLVMIARQAGYRLKSASDQLWQWKMEKR